MSSLITPKAQRSIISLTGLKSTTPISSAPTKKKKLGFSVAPFKNRWLLPSVNKCYLLGNFVNIIISFDWCFVAVENRNRCRLITHTVVSEIKRARNGAHRKRAWCLSRSFFFFVILFWGEGILKRFGFSSFLWIHEKGEPFLLQWTKYSNILFICMHAISIKNATMPNIGCRGVAFKLRLTLTI